MLILETNHISFIQYFELSNETEREKERERMEKSVRCCYGGKCFPTAKQILWLVELQADARHGFLSGHPSSKNEWP